VAGVADHREGGATQLAPRSKPAPVDFAAARSISNQLHP
jgi:hypothetical protein